MHTIHRQESIVLFLGDILVFGVSLILSLFIRYGNFPTVSSFDTYYLPFSILFTIFILINFIAGLYEKHTLLFKNRLPSILLNVQLVNAGIGIAFFYFLPIFLITPKVILFIYLVVSLLLMFAWRMYIAPKLSSGKTQKAIMIGDTKEAEELYKEINNNSRYHINFIGRINPSSDIHKTIQEISEYVKNEKTPTIFIDTRHPNLIGVIPELYKYAISGILFFDISKMYESIFDRIPISLITQNWFIENMSSVAPKFLYDSLKRLLDIIVSSFLCIPLFILFPFVVVAMKIEGKGVIFSYQDRIGQFNKIVRIMKFRTMTVANDSGKWGSVENKVTKLGTYLRKTRIDELPQLLNVLKGDISLIGPRPEFPDPVKQYAEQIPYYNIRHTIKPGLSGWAQIYHEQHPHHGLDIEETRNKLSYDLYYVKHRSFSLDLKISLRTLKVLITFAGR